MIHFFGLVSRIKEISSQEFHDHWRHPHGTLGRLVPGPLCYVQSHQIHTDLLGPDQARFDGVGELIFETAKAAMELWQDPYYTTYVQPDEPTFIDVPRIEWLYTTEEILVSHDLMPKGFGYEDIQWIHDALPVSIKLFQFICKDGNPDWAGLDDIELGCRIGALRHVRNYPVQEIHAENPPYMGIRQLWWPTLSAFEAGVRKDPEAFSQLILQKSHAVTLLTQAERLLH
jgi:hypothetical protein